VKVDKAQRKRKLTAASSAIVLAPNPTPRQTKIALLIKLADECGFACLALTQFKTALVTAIVKSLVHREGKSVYQSVAFKG
jgi:hypothetical protein